MHTSILHEVYYPTHLRNFLSIGFMQNGDSAFQKLYGGQSDYQGFQLSVTISLYRNSETDLSALQRQREKNKMWYYYTTYYYYKEKYVEEWEW